MKSGTALLLFRLQRLWYCLQIQTATPKSTLDMYYPPAQLRAWIKDTYHEDIFVSQCFGFFMNLPDSCKPKQSAQDAFFNMSPLFYAVGTSGVLNYTRSYLYGYAGPKNIFVQRGWTVFCNQYRFNQKTYIACI